MNQVNLDVPIPELGLTFKQLLDSIRTIFSDISNDNEKLLDAFTVDTAVGNDLDHIGALFSVNRKSSETDIAYRVRLNLFLGDHDKRSLALGDITTLSQRILGIEPEAVREYPDFDFTHHTGKPYPGVHIEYTVADIETYLEDFKVFRDVIDLYKAAGVPFIIGPIKTLLEQYTAFYNYVLQIGVHFKPNEELYKFPISRFDISGAGFNESTFESQVVVLDHWGAQIPFFSSVELITDIFDVFKAIWKLFVSETYSLTINEDLLTGLGFHEHIHSGMDAQRFEVSRFDIVPQLINDTFGTTNLLAKFTETIIAFITSEVISTDTKGYFAELIPFIDLVDTFKGIGTKDFGLERIGGFDVDLFDAQRFNTIFQDIILLIIIKPFTELVSVYSDDIRLNPKGYFTELISVYSDDIKAPSDMKVILLELLSVFVDTFSIGDIILPFTELISVYLDTIDFNGVLTQSELVNLFVDTFKASWITDLGTEKVGGFDVDLFDVQRFNTVFQDILKLIITKPFTESISVYSEDIKLNPYGYFTEVISSFVDTIKAPSDMKAILTELLSTFVETFLGKPKALLIEDPFVGTSGGTTTQLITVPLKVGSGTVESGDVGVIGSVGNQQVLMEESYA